MAPLHTVGRIVRYWFHRHNLREFSARDAVTAALADMREGRRVAVICQTRDAARSLLGSAASQLKHGEKAYRAHGCTEITGSGWISFMGCEGLTMGRHRGAHLHCAYIERGSQVPPELLEALTWLLMHNNPDPSAGITYFTS